MLLCLVFTKVGTCHPHRQMRHHEVYPESVAANVRFSPRLHPGARCDETDVLVSSAVNARALRR